MTATSSVPRTPRYPLWAGRTTALSAIAVSALNLRSAVTSLSPLLHGIGNEFGFGAGTIGVFGMLPPGCFALFGALTHSRTPAGSAVTSGFVQGVGGASAVLGPLFFGLLHTWTGTWGTSYALVGASLAVPAISGIRERRHRTLEDDIARTENGVESRDKEPFGARY